MFRMNIKPPPSCLTAIHLPRRWEAVEILSFQSSLINKNLSFSLTVFEKVNAVALANDKSLDNNGEG